MSKVSEIIAAQKIFEIFCGGSVDWANHSLDDKDDNIFLSADWDQALLYARAALEAVSSIHEAEPVWNSEWPPLIELSRVLGSFATTLRDRHEWTAVRQADYDRANQALQLIFADLTAHPAPISKGVTADQGDLGYLLACVEAHADKFPVPEHMRSLVKRIHAACLPHTAGEP